MGTITTADGTEIYYKDWGEGPTVTFSRFEDWLSRSTAHQQRTLVKGV